MFQETAAMGDLRCRTRCEFDFFVFFWLYLTPKSVRGGHWIVLPNNKEEHLAHLKAKQDIYGKFVVVSWISESIHKTIYEGIIRPLTPLITIPLFSDTNPKQAAALIADTGDRPAWGLVTNAKRLNPAKAFQAKVWVPQKKKPNLT
jgi:hypothetical protein